MDFWEFLWPALMTMLFIGVIFTWFFAALDLFARADLGWIMKAFWLLAIIFLPLAGLLLYFLFRPNDARWYGATDLRPYTYSRDWQVGELQTLARMRDQGTITDAEFVVMKERVVTETPAGFQPPAGEPAG